MLLSIAVLAIVPKASASPSARLVYARSADASTCPDETALRGAVAARFGYDPFFAWAKRTVVVEVWRRGEQSSRTAQIGAERVLLDEARGAIVQGDPIRALARIEQHRRTFATAILSEERDAMEVEALAKAGRSAEARAKADAFRRHMPNSLFLPAVESAVESIP
jgi:hypothetical protein